MKVSLPLSKSIVARCLITSALINKGKCLPIIGDQAPDDLQYLYNSIENIRNHQTNSNKNDKKRVYVHQSGTALRLLTALCSLYEGKYIIDGDPQISRRPIAPLVDELNKMGANIQYIGEKEGYPPILIEGRITATPEPRIIDVSGWKSSQYATALLLIAPYIGGITLRHINQLTSAPYLHLTLKVMAQYGAKIHLNEERCTVFPGEYHSPTLLPYENDWSAASYWYAYLLMKDDDVQTFTLPNLRLNSLQGDKVMVEISHYLGIKTKQEQNDIIIYKDKRGILPEAVDLDLNPNPDLFPTLAVTLAIMGIPFHLRGLSNQRSKESNRIKSVIEGLQMIGITDLLEQEDSIIYKGKTHLNRDAKGVIKSYDDHRIAMIFYTTIRAKKLAVTIDNLDCIDKSYPTFTNQMALL